MVARPLSAEELLQAADLAGYARVVSVEGDRVSLRFSRILKGRPLGAGLLHRLGFARTVTVRLRPPITGAILGPWSDHGAYVLGEEVKTHLRWNAERNGYETSWWNAVSTVR